MKRTAIESLKKWKEKKGHKPLILQGARQVGKTWLMKEFGNMFYKQTAYFQFDNNPQLAQIFEQDYNISRIIEALELLSGMKLDPKNTLILFDEIQECPKAFTSLKYFQENAPQYDIIAAGSLLGLMHHTGTGFPVGKVSFLNLYPLSFVEFAEALGEERFIDIIRKKDFEMVRTFKNQLEQLLKMYCYVGGMPEVVQDFVENHDYNTVRQIQTNILLSYEDDFSKHIPANTVEKVRMLWKSIPSQLAKENKKFIYSVIKKGARAKEYELALHWLKDAGLIYQVYRVKKPHLPLMAYQDLEAFKLFILDVGLLGALTGLDAKTMLEKTRIFEEFKGAIAEQYVCQQLISTDDTTPLFYWTNDTSRSKIDFIIQLENNIIPLEVKASTNLRAKSLKNFIDTFKSHKAVRTSLADYKYNAANLYDIPLYAIWNIGSITIEKPKNIYKRDSIS